MDATKLSLSSSLLYGASFLAPISNDLYGWQAFATCIWFPLLWPAWIANVFLWVALAKTEPGNYGLAAVSALIALIHGLFGVIPVGGPFAWGLGYWMWLGSMALLAVGAVRLEHLDRPRPAYRVVPTPPSSCGSAG